MYGLEGSVTNGASTAPGLAPGKIVRLLVKVTAPAGAPSGLANVTTLSVTLAGSIAGVAPPAASLATDASSVVSAQLTLVVAQALDANCDGIADTPFAVLPIGVGALPGACIRYEVTATNVGPVEVTNVVVSNATPPYTTYSATVAAAASAGTVSAPPGGTAGTVQTALPRLASGGLVVLRFGVRIDP